MDLSKLTKGDRIVVASAILLVLDLLLIPWYSLTVVGVVTVSLKGVDSPDSFLGVLALLVALAMAAQVILSRFTEVKIPDIGIPWARVHFLGGLAVVIMLALKFILHTQFLSIGSYLAILFGIALAVGGFTMQKESTTAGTAG